jgi:hypothetical protein
MAGPYGNDYGLAFFLDVNRTLAVAKRFCSQRGAL